MEGSRSLWLGPGMWMWLWLWLCRGPSSTPGPRGRAGCPIVGMGQGVGAPWVLGVYWSQGADASRVPISGPWLNRRLRIFNKTCLCFRPEKAKC